MEEGVVDLLASGIIRTGHRLIAESATCWTCQLAWSDAYRTCGNVSGCHTGRSSVTYRSGVRCGRHSWALAGVIPGPPTLRGGPA